MRFALSTGGDNRLYTSQPQPSRKWVACLVLTNRTPTASKILRATDTLGAAAEVLHAQVVAAHLSTLDNKGEVYYEPLVPSSE